MTDLDHEAARIAAPADKLEYMTQRIGELLEEGDGFWRACSGCQESIDGYVSHDDYPYSAMFRCQPGSGCRECGGIGVIWDDTDYDAMARWMLADEAKDLTMAGADTEFGPAIVPLAAALDAAPPEGAA